VDLLERMFAAESVRISMSQVREHPFFVCRVGGDALLDGYLRGVVWTEQCVSRVPTAAVDWIYAYFGPRHVHEGVDVEEQYLKVSELSVQLSVSVSEEETSDSDESGSGSGSGLGSRAVSLSLSGSLMRAMEKDEYLEVTPHTSPMECDVESFEGTEEWVSIDVDAEVDEVGNALRVMNMGRFSIEKC